jgi:mannan endo-1,4-beta-mannosidase
MRQLIRLLFISLFIVLGSMEKTHAQTTSFRDKATDNLYANLKKLAVEKKIMFGCANPTTLKYKETHIREGFTSSDCKDITGQNPAFYESDFMWHVNDTLRKADILASKLAYERGAVIGYCWHLRGMKSQSFYAKGKQGASADSLLVKKIVAGGNRLQNPELDWLLTLLDTLVIPTIKDFGFPIVFRPWHEMNGGWFYWGKDNCTPEEYIQLYRITVDYMRLKGVKNVLYSWSPDTKFTLEYYPGDAYVDILGLDIYEIGAADYKPLAMILGEIGKITDFATDHQKVAAITETGLRMEGNHFRYPNEIPDYWTKCVLEPIVNDAKASRVVWIESWYSADWSKKRKGQFYIPYLGLDKDQPKGQQAIDDFIQFYKHPATLFEDDLPNMYQ